MKARFSSYPTFVHQSDSGRGHRVAAHIRTVCISVVGVLASLVVLASVSPVSAAVKSKEVVALTPFSANAMALMGAYPAAVGQTLGGDRRLVSGLRRTPILTLSHTMNGPNKEELASYQPKLIFTSPTWAGGRSMMEEVVGEVDGKVVNADPKSIQEVYSTTRRISKLIGRKARGKKLVKRMKRGIVKARRGLNRTRKVRVMVILGVGRTPFVFLPNSWGGQIVKLAGGNLLTGGARSKGGFAKIGDDVVVDQQPDVIIAVPHADTENIPAAIDYLKNNPAWANTPAAKKGRIVVSTDNSILQAGTDIGATIKKIRTKALKNG